MLPVSSNLVERNTNMGEEGLQQRQLKGKEQERLKIHKNKELPPKPNPMEFNTGVPS